MYYCDHVDHVHLAAGDDELQDLPDFIDVKKMSEAALKNVYDGFSGLVEPNLFKLTNEAIGHGITVGVLQYGKPNPAFLGHMHKTGTWFSARKSYVQQQELAKLLMSEDGTTKRPWREFKKAAQGIVGAYNERWLKTEYNTAIRAARMGSRWQEFAANSDLYPNLEYLPSRAATPREEHKPFYHVIRAFDDPFWATHYPPSDYNCVCGAEPTDEDETPLPEVQPKPAPGLDHNPGQTEQVFSDSHPYTVQLQEEKADIDAIDQDGERLQREADYQTLRLSPSFMDALNKTDSLQSQFPTADHEELAATFDYSRSAYYDLNRWLRGNFRGARPDQEQYFGAFTRVLSSLLNKLPKYTKRVYRGDDLPQSVIDGYRDALSRKVPIQHKGFTSTSASANKAFEGPQRFVIKSKTGRKIKELSDFKSEEEVLFDAGTWFLVEKMETKDGLLWIYLKETKSR
ncbi:hypothetical protein DYU11_18430 [Fibrisoma montanum]|uniref:NAD(+)--protein-arginine ADP-ribosyltransferase n=1 Tax=Fibrisoma montanum TaxID=2305895 RepID=A0A418M676_9BACT|nr:hypothetical protein DYU11_18430 [Fibrisoma montanum]